MKNLRQHTKGFSLLEMVVAIAILAVSLGTLYQAVGGATRNVRSDERYAYAVELARSLLATNTQVPAQGLAQSGETDGKFEWSVNTAPIDRNAGMSSGLLQLIDVSVSWQDGDKRRQVQLQSIVEGSAQ